MADVLNPRSSAAEQRALARVAGLQASGATLNEAGQAALAKSQQLTATSTDPTKIDAMTVTGTPSSRLSGGKQAQTNVSAQNVKRLDTIANVPTGSDLQRAAMVYNPTTGQMEVSHDSTGAAVTVNYGKVSQAELQKIVKDSVAARLTKAQSDLTAGTITQQDYDTIAQDVQERTEASDRIMSMSGFSTFNDIESARKTALEALEEKQKTLQAKYQEAWNRGNMGDQAGREGGFTTGQQAKDEAAKILEEINALPTIAELSGSYSEAATKLGEYYTQRKEAEINAPTPTVLGTAPTATVPTTTPTVDAYGNPVQANGSNVAPTTTTAAIQGLIQSSDPATAAMLQTAMGILGQRMQDIGTQYTDEKNRAEDEFSMYQEIVNEMTQRQSDLSAMKMNLLKTTQAESETLAKLQEQSALAANETARQQTELNLQEQRRQLAVANSKKVQSMISRNAVLGGFGSMASLAEIERTDQEGATAIANFTAQMALIDKSYADKALEIGANYTNTMVTIHQNYANSMIDVITKYNDKVDEATKLKIGGAQRMEDKLSAARTTMKNDWNKVQDDTLKYVQDAVKQAQTAINETKKEQRADTQSAMGQLFDAAKTWGTNTPQTFIDKLQKQLPDIDVKSILSSPTLSQAAKTEKEQADKTVSSLVGQAQVDGTDLGLMAARALGRRTLRQRIDEAEIMQQMIDNKDMEGLKEQILITSTNSLSTKTRESVEAANESLKDTALIQDKLDTFEQNYGGLWKNALEKGKALAELRDPKWVDLVADIGGMQAELRKKFAGVALTPTEAVYLNQFLVDFNRDNVKDMLTKIENLQQNLVISKQTRYDTLLGKGAYQTLTGEGYTPSSDMPFNQTYDDSYFEQYFPTSSGSSINSSATSMRTDRNNNPTAFTINIAKQGGLIEGIDYEKGDPFPNNPNLYTARLIGDPISKTIEVIDRIGFYTNGGNQRWTHTAMSKAAWNKLSYDQKIDVVKKMYQYEGGNELASLFPQNV